MFPFGSIALNINVWVRLLSTMRSETHSLLATACEPPGFRVGFVSQILYTSELNLIFRNPIEQSPVKSKRAIITRQGCLAIKRPNLSKAFSKNCIIRIFMVFVVSEVNFSINLMGLPQ